MIQLKDISKDNEIIAGRRGSFCVLANEAVKLHERTGVPGSPAGRRLSGVENQTIRIQLK